MKLSAAEKQGMSPTEIAALEGDGVDTALATMGDDVPTSLPAAAGSASDADDNADDDLSDAGTGADDDAANAAAPAPAPAAAEDGTLTAEQLAAIAKDTAPEPAKLPTYEVPTKDFAAERKALRESRKEIQAKWDQGDLTDEELQTQLDAVDDQLEALTAEKVRADTLRDLNEQHAREAQAKIDAEFNTATAAIIKAAATSATAKVDYVKDKGAQRQFDMALDMLQADEANAGKTPTQLVAEAHKAVLVIRGLPIGNAAPAPAPAPAAVPAAPRPRDVPVTLGGLPNASQVPLQDETLAQASRLSGEDLENFLSRLPPAQQQRLLRSIDNGAVH